MQRKRKKALFYILFIVSISLPLVFMLTPLKVKPLKGAVEKSELPELNCNTWFDGSFQESLEKFVNDNIGFRPWFVRIHNQIQYSFFDKAHAHGVINGKDNYLYELNYIKAYNGQDFLGHTKIIE